MDGTGSRPGAIGGRDERRRDARGVRRYTRDGELHPVVGSRRRKTPTTDALFCSLVLPALAVGIVGFLLVIGHGMRPHYSSIAWKTIWLTFGTAICVARTWSTIAPRWIKFVALTASGLFPLAILLVALGMWP